MRNAIVAVVVGSMISTLAVVGPSGPGKLLAQATDAEQVPPPAPEQLRRGQRATTPLWDLEVDNVFIADSPSRFGWSEVRLELAIHNRLDLPIPYSDTAFFDGALFPRLLLVDSDGYERPYNAWRPHRTAVGTSWVRQIPPGLTATWTVGFQVPTKATEQLFLSASLDGVTFAIWDLLSGDTRQLWAPPAGMPTVALGDTIQWAEDLEVTPVDFGFLVCGDTELQYVTQIMALRVDVANLDVENDLPFPGNTFPATTAVAQWSNGSTAEMTNETFFGESEQLRKLSGDLVLVPPTRGDLHSRALMFAVPRDGRMISPSDPPVGVQLNRPDGTSVWLPLEGEGTVAVNPAWCDDGHFPFTVPYAYGPSHDFEVGLATPAATAEEQDRAAQELLSQALIAVGRYYSLNGSYSRASAAAFESLWAAVDFEEDTDDTDVGIVSFDVAGANQIVLTTQSASGTYFCAGEQVGVAPVFASGEVLSNLQASCLEAPTEEEPPEEGEGDGDGDAAA